MLHKEAISPRILEVIRKLMSIEEFNAFRLVGGTALALQIGHRESIDIDMFSYRYFPLDVLKDVIKNDFEGYTEINFGKRSLSFYYEFVRLDFYSMSEPFIRPEFIAENIRMASIEDIAAMKLDTISARATKKDYFDIAELLKTHTLKKLLNFYNEKYPEYSIRNVINVIKEIPIRNFELEATPDPKTLISISWKEVKNKIFSAFDEFRNEELNQKIEEMKKREKGIKGSRQ